MALTVTNTNTIALLNILNRNSAAQANTLKQLTTGKRINSGKDDPAGLIAFSNLNAELTAVNAALTNNQRTDSVLTVADGAIEEISSLLNEIETLVVASTSDANLTAAEIAANQSQIDDALSAIDRIVRTTNFNGKRLLDGSFSIQTSGVAGNSKLNNVRIYSRSQSTADTVLNITRTASAQLASVALQGNTTTVAADGGMVTSGVTELAITGTLGTATITLSDGLSKTQIRDIINQAVSQTGVSATLSSVAAGTLTGASGIRLDSTTFGSSAFVSVEVLSGGAVNTASGTADNGAGAADDFQSVGKTSGVDAAITINGQAAGVDGLDVTYSANGLGLSFTLAQSYGDGTVVAGQTAAQQQASTFTVLPSGGATFQLGTTSSTRQTIGIDSLAPFKLGGGNGSAKLSALQSGGAQALKTDPGGALTAVREAIADVAGVRGRIGGFQKFQVGSAIRSLQAAQTGLSEATSVISDTDFAIATAQLNQQQVLIQSSISLLGIINQQASAILSLL